MNTSPPTQSPTFQIPKELLAAADNKSKRVFWLFGTGVTIALSQDDRAEWQGLLRYSFEALLKIVHQPDQLADVPFIKQILTEHATLNYLITQQSAMPLVGAAFDLRTKFRQTALKLVRARYNIGDWHNPDFENWRNKGCGEEGLLAHFICCGVHELIGKAMGRIAGAERTREQASQESNSETDGLRQWLDFFKELAQRFPSSAKLGMPSRIGNRLHQIATTNYDDLIARLLGLPVVETKGNTHRVLPVAKQIRDCTSASSPNDPIVPQGRKSGVEAHTAIELPFPVPSPVSTPLWPQHKAGIWLQAVLHLHGWHSLPKSIALSPESYARMQEEWLNNWLRDNLLSHIFLVIGMGQGMLDGHFLDVWDELPSGGRGPQVFWFLESKEVKSCNAALHKHNLTEVIQIIEFTGFEALPKLLAELLRVLDPVLGKTVTH